MAKPIRVLCVHGVNVSEKDTGWQPGWTQAIETEFKQAGAQVQIQPTSLPYDEYEMWVPRDFKPLNKALAGKPEYVGRSGTVKRLGRSASLLTLDNRAYDRVTRAQDHKGPYLPLIIQACREAEYSYEYKHGFTAYGAFTYSLARMLRALAKQGRTPTFADLVKLTAKDLTALGYDQHPVILGPKTVTVSPLPWRGGTAAKTTALRGADA